MEVPEFVWRCSHDLEVIGSVILEVLLRLSLCRRNAPNYCQNDGLLETSFSVKKLIVGSFCDTLITFIAKANMKVF